MILIRREPLDSTNRMEFSPSVLFQSLESSTRRRIPRVIRVEMVGTKFAILAVTCLSLLTDFSLANKTEDKIEVQVQHKKLDFPEKELIFSHESYVDGSDVYAACKNVEKSEDRLCKIVRAKTPNSRELQSCDLTLRLDNRTKNGDKKKDKLAVAPLGQDHAVLYLAEESKNASVKFSIVNFNDCKIVETTITVMNPDLKPKFAVIVVPYNDSFDVYYRDSDKCSQEGFCKIVVDTEGKVIHGPEAAIDTNLYQSFFPYIVPLCTKTRDKGVFYMKHVNGSLSEYDFIVHKPDGTKKSLGKHKAYSPTRKSTAHGLIGVCFTNDLVNSTIACTQYDDNGNLKFEVEAMSTNDSAAIVHVYNLPKGGFLLLAGKCAEKPSCALDEVTFQVVKMDETGKKVGTYTMDKLTFESGIKDIKMVPAFYAGEDDKYCVSIAQYKSTDTGHRDVGYISSTTACLADADFVN